MLEIKFLQDNEILLQAVSVVLITYGFLHCLHPERFSVKDADTNHLDLGRILISLVTK